MKTETLVKKAIAAAASPLPCIRVRVTRKTAMKFAKPRTRGGTLFIGDVEIILIPPLDYDAPL